MANDSHPGGASLTITQVEGNEVSAGQSLAIRGGRVQFDGHNTLIFTPEPAFSGPVAFTYTAVDGHGRAADAVVTSTAALAALAPQLDTTLEAHGLPHVADLDDLLAIASVVAPGAFGTPATVSGRGYQAGLGHGLDLDTATTNPGLLMQALLVIVGIQTSGTGDPLLAADAGGGWTSAVDQSLVFQSVLSSDSEVQLDFGEGGARFRSSETSGITWSKAFAQRMLDPGASSGFVIQSDGQVHASSYQSTVASGSPLSVSIGGAATGTPQAALSNLFGFVDFVSADGHSAVKVARPVMLALTPGGADDQHATVAMRQGGKNSMEVQFYRVDDYCGTIDGLHPGDAGYEAASQARAYHTTADDTWIPGAGYGAFNTTDLTGVNFGDFMVMRLSNGTDIFYSFAQANEMVNGERVNHVWNYGLNTWGWEDLHGGGDQDFNDLVVRLDFTLQQDTVIG